MRIRTIKPEFWSNEKLASLPDFARLVAIGLLNYADDEGYFWANPLLLRGALFPFDEDSSKLRRSIAQLVEKGYIKVGKTADGRECGHVVNFCKHQRIDRPKPSEIKQVAQFDEQSTNDRRIIDDESLLEGKGKEGKGGQKDGVDVSTPNDETWLAELSAKPAYNGIDVRREFSKMETWCAANKKQATRRRFINWLNRVDKPLSSIPTARPTFTGRINE